jgi:hypothetical protein
VMNTHLGSRVARLNPSWNQAYTDETLMAGFLKAVELTGVGHMWADGRQRRPQPAPADSPQCGWWCQGRGEHGHQRCLPACSTCDSSSSVCGRRSWDAAQQPLHRVRKCVGVCCVYLCRW